MLRDGKEIDPKEKASRDERKKRRRMSFFSFFSRVTISH